jgi:hypothetical protein
VAPGLRNKPCNEIAKSNLTNPRLTNPRQSKKNLELLRLLETG